MLRPQLYGDPTHPDQLKTDPHGLSVSINPRSLFDEVNVVETTPIFELKSNYGLSDLRDITSTAGSGAVTNAVGDGEYLVATTANGADTARLDTAERGRYVPGMIGKIGIGVRRPTAPTGNQVALWGYTDGTDGVYFGEDATGLYVALLNDGTETKIRQSAWNQDTLDGAGPSGLTLDMTRGNVFQAEYAWYGYGGAEFYVCLPDAKGAQRRYLVHTVSASAGLIFQNPNLPVRASVVNGGTATAFSMFVGGRQYSVEGEYRPNERITPEYRLSLGSIGTTFLPLVTFRRKSAYLGVGAKLAGFDVLTDADAIVELVLDATLTGASYGAPTDVAAAETAFEADNSATAISGGHVLWRGFVAASGSGSNSQGFRSSDIPEIDFLAAQPVTLAIRRITGTAATASAIMRVREEW